MAGSWALVEELFARGDAAFVPRAAADPRTEQLGGFAARWLADPRPFARGGLFEYLARPLNSYRHEPLVERLFKRAEAAGDDEAVGAFPVAFDRTKAFPARYRDADVDSDVHLLDNWGLTHAMFHLSPALA